MLLRTKIGFAAGFVIGVLVHAGHRLEAAEFQGLGDLPLGRYSSDATGISADGSVVVGVSYSVNDRWQGFRWDAEFGMQPFGVNYAQDVSGDGNAYLVGVGYEPGVGAAAVVRLGTHGIPELDRIGLLPGGINTGGSAISADGSVVVGGAESSLGTQAFRWTKETGIIGLGDLDGGDAFANAWGVSGDGQVIVGSGSREAGNEAFRWTAETGMVGLGTLPGMDSSSAWAANRDGSVVVGDSFIPDTQYEAFRWTEATGLVGLGDLPGGMALSRAFAVSADGSVIVGGAGTDLGDEAFLWDADHGMRNLQQLLIDDYGLANALDGWTLTRAADVSADGRVIVGAGINPDGNEEAWRAVLVPEPSTGALMLLALVAWAACSRGPRRC